MSYSPPDYSDPRYGLSEEQLRSIKILQALPSWEARSSRNDPANTPKQDRAPFIYKYVGFDQSSELDMKRARDFICKGHLWISGLDKLNDVDEGATEVRFVADAVVRRKWAEAHVKKLVRGVPKPERKAAFAGLLKRVMARIAMDSGGMQAVHQKELLRFGVHCFSIDPRNLQMWGLYADGQSGVCFQLRREKCLGVLALTHAVVYQEDPVRLAWPLDKERVIDALRTKSHGWAYEAEVRYITRWVYQQSLPFDARALTRIIVGRRFDDSVERINALLSLLLERLSLGLPRPKLYRVASPKGTYRCQIFRAIDLEQKLDELIHLNTRLA